LRALPKIDPEALYLRLPIPLQHAACTFIGWRTSRTRYGGRFDSMLTEAEARTFWTADELRAHQEDRLQKFVAHAVASAPFYRERFAAAGVDPSAVRSIEDLRAMPILTKEEAQKNVRELISTVVPDTERTWIHTSGTTGGALRFPTTMTSVQLQWAVWWRYKRWHGIQRHTRCGYFGGRSIVPAAQSSPPFWRYNRAGKQILFSGYHMSPANLPSYVEELRRRQPPWLFGYPSLLALLASHILETGTDLGYAVRWITIGAESLLAHQADVIARAFGVRPLQHYGMSEAVANISECELGALHVDEDFAPVEFVPLENGSAYKVVGTNFSNPATPLLRYEMKDLVTIRPEASCACGRAGRVVESLDGRIEDYVVLPNGTRVGRMDHVFKDMVNVKEAQIQQRRRGHMMICVVRGAGYSAHDEEELLREARKRVGDEMDIEIAYSEELPRTATGKLRLVVSEVEGASIRMSHPR
jgi:phenylacetate-coenzyme A ligase PaaK-like adenylate-forming protein